MGATWIAQEAELAQARAHIADCNAFIADLEALIMLRGIHLQPSLHIASARIIHIHSEQHRHNQPVRPDSRHADRIGLPTLQGSRAAQLSAAFQLNTVYTPKQGGAVFIAQGQPPRALRVGPGHVLQRGPAPIEDRYETHIALRMYHRGWWMYKINAAIDDFAEGGAFPAHQKPALNPHRPWKLQHEATIGIDGLRVRRARVQCGVQ